MSPTGTERKLTLPAGGSFTAAFSRDSKKIAITHTTDNGIRLLVADVATAAVRPVLDGGVNGLAGGCSWLDDSNGFLCRLIPDGRGGPPAETAVPTGPNIQENLGAVAAGRTYQDLLTSPHEERLYDYYYTSQPAWVGLDGQKTTFGTPAVYASLALSTDGQWLVVDAREAAVFVRRARGAVPARRRALGSHGQGGAQARRRADGRHDSDQWRVRRTARIHVARARAGDAVLGRGARQRRHPEQGPASRSRDGDQGAVHRPAGRAAENGMAVRRHPVHREELGAVERKRSRDADAPHLGVRQRRARARPGSCCRRIATRIPALRCSGPARRWSCTSATRSTSRARARRRKAIGRSSIGSTSRR